MEDELLLEGSLDPLGWLESSFRRFNSCSSTALPLRRRRDRDSLLAAF
jgi:hypothetical protein